MFKVVKKIISTDVAEILGQSILFTKMIDSEPEQDSQVQGSYAKYAVPVTESLLEHLKPTIEEHTGLKLHPTYSYVRVYELGHSLKKHLDRPSCEISVSITLKYEKSRFPLQIEGKTIDLEQGDGFIYRGCELEHWRDEYEGEEGSFQVQVFLHYVDANGPFSQYKYDKRSSLGIEKPKNYKIIGFPMECIYWSKIENHEKIKEKYMKRILDTERKPHWLFCNVKTTFDMRNTFLDNEDIKQIIWDKIDDMIYQINKSDGIHKILPSHSILKEYWLNYYSYCNDQSFQEIHNHLINPMIIKDETYYPSFSGIYILHDENDVSNTVFQSPSSIQLPFFPYFKRFVVDTGDYQDVKEGSVIIFPSTLEHLVKPCIKKRITLAFNVFSKYNVK
uniref:Prolyl 4-hydroxylase alpha subunit Fe(2+) 2OG dioxygenase domain-containing protein n=1 Tax=viral metagenome TaxID=1070528 RepID=A0A6C0JWC4_9ZZZZ